MLLVSTEHLVFFLERLKELAEALVLLLKLGKVCVARLTLLRLLSVLVEELVFAGDEVKQGLAREMLRLRRLLTILPLVLNAQVRAQYLGLGIKCSNGLAHGPRSLGIRAYIIECCMQYVKCILALSLLQVAARLRLQSNHVGSERSDAFSWLFPVLVQFWTKLVADYFLGQEDLLEVLRVADSLSTQRWRFLIHHMYDVGHCLS